MFFYYPVLGKGIFFLLLLTRAFYLQLLSVWMGCEDLRKMLKFTHTFCSVALCRPASRGVLPCDFASG